MSTLNDKIVIVTGANSGMGMLKPFFQTPEQGTRTAIYLASSKEVQDITGEYFYKCKIAKSSKRSKDMELAKRLFEFSERLVGCKYQL